MRRAESRRSAVIAPPSGRRVGGGYTEAARLVGAGRSGARAEGWVSGRREPPVRAGAGTPSTHEARLQTRPRRQRPRAGSRRRRGGRAGRRAAPWPRARRRRRRRRGSRGGSRPPAKPADASAARQPTPPQPVRPRAVQGQRAAAVEEALVQGRGLLLTGGEQQERVAGPLRGAGAPAPLARRYASRLRHACQLRRITRAITAGAKWAMRRRRSSSCSFQGAPRRSLPPTTRLVLLIAPSPSRLSPLAVHSNRADWCTRDGRDVLRAAT